MKKNNWMLLIISFLVFIFIFGIYNGKKDNKISVNNFVNEVSEKEENFDGKITYDFFTGSNKYEKSISISKELYPNGCNFVILINVSDKLSGYLSSSLASALNASVLYVDKDFIRAEVFDEIKRLNPKNIYVLGDNSYISDEVILEINQNLNYNIKRIGGEDNFDFSINVANEINSINNVSSVFLVSDENFAAVASCVSGKFNMPILLIDREKLDSSVVEFIINAKKLKNVYVSADIVSESVVKNLRELGKNVQSIYGNNTVEFNIRLLKKFIKKFDNIILTNDLDDVSLASLITRKDKYSLFYFENDLSENYYDIIKNNIIKKILYFKNSDVIKLREALFTFKKSLYSDSNYDLLFSNKKAVFYVPHQDDETLFYSQTITAAIDKLGADNVHVILITDGNASLTQKNPFVKNSIKHYNEVNSLNLKFYQSRDEEYVLSLRELGVKHIEFIENYGFERFPDSGFSKKKKNYINNYNRLKEFMLYMDNKFESDVTHLAYTYYDIHPDHVALGEALSDLYFDSNNALDKFDDVYLILKSTEMLDETTHVWPDNMASKFSKIDNLPEKYLIHINYNKDFDKIRNAINRYGYYKNKDGCISDDNTLGIGCMSVRYLFVEVDNRLYPDSKNPLITAIHVPFK